MPSSMSEPDGNRAPAQWLVLFEDCDGAGAGAPMIQVATVLWGSCSPVKARPVTVQGQQGQGQGRPEQASSVQVLPRRRCLIWLSRIPDR
ncbi:hypothetical protein ACFVH0_01035 [Streptomyces sp. NPDC127117]|uniref:hypothetical protein n=1 Tax=Streptomyces sp. NPDC127117 TaxID=3345368 RepID=UPI003626E9AB